MKDRAALLIAKIQLSATTIVWVLSKRRYALLALLVSILFFELIYWLFNMPVLVTILSSSSVTLSEKTAVLLSPIESIAASSSVTAVTLMVLLAGIQGVSLSVLTYLLRHQRKVDESLIGGSSIAALLAVIGLGCPACGTSLITPIVALFVSGSAVALSEQITTVATPLAIVVGLYGLYAIGLKTAQVRVASGGAITIPNAHNLQ